jgi:hypothetical protein
MSDLLRLAADSDGADPHLFRRQYLLGPAGFRPNLSWKVVRLLPELILSVHADLPVAIRRSPQGAIVLLGTLVDPFAPGLSAVELLERFRCKPDTTIHELAHWTNRLSGRWVLIHAHRERLIALCDPCGFRPLCYHVRNGAVWCGSQPEIIRTQVPLRRRSCSELSSFTSSAAFKNHEEAWVGAKTIYEGCQFLLPNHCLDLSTGRAERFFPTAPLPEVDVESAIGVVATCIRGGIQGIRRYGRLSMAVTAGMDTRVLLAAAKPILSEIRCYVDRQGRLSPQHPDVTVPQRLASRLGFKFVVENSTRDPDSRFMQRLSRNVTGARRLPKSRIIYSKYLRNEERININGNVSEICRHKTDEFVKLNGRIQSAHELAQHFGYADDPFVLRELQYWLDGLRDARPLGAHRLNLPHWEQRMGRWGALFPAEQDIAVDEFSPFNNRLALTTLLALPSHLRVAPDFFAHRMIIEKLWPETLAEPINPPFP